MFLLLDNYDSFTYNLRHYLGELGAEVEVRRNDAVSADEALSLGTEGIVISPGPCDPDRAGICLEVMEKAAGRLPVLGVCLGHQCIVEHFGGQIIAAESLMHGKTSRVKHDGETIYAGLPNPFKAGRYHSLAADRSQIPDELEITARTADGEIMGVKHRDLAVQGVQFHPESVLTPQGPTVLENFLRPQRNET